VTLHDVIVCGGLVVSTSLLAVLASFWPVAKKDLVICFKAQIDEECTPACQRTCHLKAA
jgi:hypothetical protein